jgi:FAD/FMN-containing dehydrogenase
VGGLDELRREIRGTVLGAEDVGYANAIAAWNLAATHTPRVVVVAAGPPDVVAAVRYAADAGLGIGVQATGHGPVLPVDGMLINTSRMDGVSVDPVARTAAIGAGSPGGSVLAAAQEHGLAPLLGASPTVGAIGLTLGGGLGWLSRRYGPACDAVRSFDVVTPNACLVRASADENADLFRALRGGGGGVLGVVTGMVVDLFPVTRVYAGNLVYPATAAVGVTERYARWVEQAPDDLTSSIVFMNFPADPAVPTPMRGQSFVMVRGCWCGDLGEGRGFVDDFRVATTPAMDAWSEMSFADSATISNDPVEPMPVVGTGAWLTRLDGDVAAVLASHTFPTAGRAPVTFSEVRHLGGAVTRRVSHDSVMGNRDRQFLLATIARADRGPLAMTSGQAELLGALGDHLSTGTFTNFVDGPARRSATQASTDASQHRALARLQARLDPHNLLRFGVAHGAG